MYRDGYHLSYGVGRYAVALLWYSVLTGNDIKGNLFCDFDEEISKSDIETAKKCVAEICRV